MFAKGSKTCAIMLISGAPLLGLGVWLLASGTGRWHLSVGLLVASFGAIQVAAALFARRVGDRFGITANERAGRFANLGFALVAIVAGLVAELSETFPASAALPVWAFGVLFAAHGWYGPAKGVERKTRPLGPSQWKKEQAERAQSGTRPGLTMDERRRRFSGVALGVGLISHGLLADLPEAFPAKFGIYFLSVGVLVLAGVWFGVGKKKRVVKPLGPSQWLKEQGLKEQAERAQWP